MYSFNAVDACEKCVEWIRNWFAENGSACNAVIGISGGKDSSVTAALCVKALGVHRVFGVLMPQGEQQDIDCSRLLCSHLGIESCVVNIAQAVDALKRAVGDSTALTLQAKTNLPARIRMAALYAVSQSRNGRVANTCNLSEDWVGYSTRYGDNAGDFSPLSCFTVGEVKEMGRHLGLPVQLVDKTPIDGLSGKSDEENLGFTYKVLDDYIRGIALPPAEVKKKIDTLHTNNLFKLEYMPCFRYVMEEQE